ncbi:unnamed protein product, partial [Rotaria magnacalcarata]
FIPLSTAGYDDPRKDHSGPAASTVVRDNQILFKVLYSNIGDDFQMGELVLQKNVRLGSTGLRLLATVGL